MKEQLVPPLKVWEYFIKLIFELTNSMVEECYQHIIKRIWIPLQDQVNLG